MKSVKFLQFATASEVIALVMLGLAVVLYMPQKITVYGQMLGGLAPFLLAQISAAFAGPQLKTFLEQRGKKNGVQEHEK